MASNYRRLVMPVDIDGDGTLEDVYVMTGNADRSYRPAWDRIVIIQAGDRNTSDGAPGSERLVQEFNRHGHVVGFIRQQIFASGVGPFELSGPAAHEMPQIHYALVEIGATGDDTYLKLRIEPRPDRDAATGKPIDPDLRYEVLARFKGINRLEVHCVWKLSDLTVMPGVAPQ